MAEYDLATEAGMLAYLRSSFNPHCEQVQRISDGIGNFVYRVQCDSPDAPSSLIAKHAESYAARAPEWKMDQRRMDFEHKALKYIESFPKQPEIPVRAPRVLQYDRTSHVLIMEDAGSLPTVKSWLQPGVDANTASSIGAALGNFLAHFHNSTAGSAGAATLSDFNGNETARYISSAAYYARLPAAAEAFGYRDERIARAAKEGQADVLESNEVLALGDFWTGNVLVRAGAGAALDLTVLDLELARPGAKAYDVGQMAAEMYCLAAFRDRERGTALLESFLAAYRERIEGGIDVAKTAVRVATHLVVMMPSAWSNEASQDSMKGQVAVGVDLLRMAVDNDMAGLAKSLVQKLIQ